MTVLEILINATLFLIGTAAIFIVLALMIGQLALKRDFEPTLLKHLLPPPTLLVITLLFASILPGELIYQFFLTDAVCRNWPILTIPVIAFGLAVPFAVALYALYRIAIRFARPLAAQVIMGLFFPTLIAFGATGGKIIGLQKPGTVIVADGKIAAAYERYRFEYQWEKVRGKELCCFNEESVSTWQSSFNPITPNPKVRDLNYFVSIASSGTPQDFLDYQAKGAKVPIDSLLYEFQEKYSREIAELYNPLSHEQQERFRGMVKDFFKDRLAGTGMRYNSAGFDFGNRPHLVGYNPWVLNQ